MQGQFDNALLRSLCTMIVSASRRTDIPAFYAPWFYNRLKEGYVLVPNPFNPRTVSRVGLTPDTVDCIVFWTKNPAPMLDGLERLRDYRYYFQFTLNPYGRDMERNLPALEARLGTFRRLAERIGPERVIWRYDPVLLGGAYDIRFHTGAFAALAAGLKGYTERCMIGFLDFYRHIRKVMDEAGAGAPSPEDTERLAAAFGDTAAKYGILLETCTSKVDLRRFGIRSGCCIDRELAERLTGYLLSARKDGGQRGVCNCAESIDIGMYGSCPHGCTYCYAVRGGAAAAAKRYGMHDIHSPMMLGYPRPEDTIRERTAESLRKIQGKLF